MPTGSAKRPRRSGDPVSVEMGKWGDRPHWRFAGVWLGRDEHGEWLGFPAGTHHARPGATYIGEVDAVTLAPSGCAHFLATFNAPGVWVDTYVDIATPPRWDADTLRSVDLDLDVVRLPGGEVYVDDEDEFAEHTVSLDYPAGLVDRALSTCAEVLASVRGGRAPFDGVASTRWREVLAGTGTSPVGPAD